MADFPAIHLDDAVVAASRPWLPASLDRMCRVKWRLTGLDGQPQVNRRVQFVNIYAPSMSGRDIIAGAFAEAFTNTNGEGNALIYRNAECEVVIDQTGIVRKVTIPDLPQAELTDLISDAPDMFSIQRSLPVEPIRRSI